MKDSKKKNSGIQNPESKIQNPKPGTLYVVSTPIGNLEDITLRALKVLKGVDIIAAENVVHTRKLCRHYGIKTKLVSYNQHNQNVKTRELIKRLKSGFDIAIVTDAGTPGISDPGAYLIKRANSEGVIATPIPGPSAVIAALSVSGMPTEKFVFLGFLPNRSGKRKRYLKGLISEKRTMVFFEAPHRVKGMLADLKVILGDRQMVLIREMTKVFEETKRGPVSVILAGLTQAQDKPRGEYTLVLEGNNEEETMDLREGVLNRIEKLLQEKRLSTKDIADLVARDEGLGYRQVYKECLSRKNTLERFEMDGSGQET
jgi:16S rRNA (cytidine1402-2'-O)-methyltransferase